MIGDGPLQRQRHAGCSTGGPSFLVVVDCEVMGLFHYLQRDSNSDDMCPGVMVCMCPDDRSQHMTRVTGTHACTWMRVISVQVAMEVVEQTHQLPVDNT